MNLLQNQHWIGIRREPGEEGRSKPGKGLFRRKQYYYYYYYYYYY